MKIQFCGEEFYAEHYEHGNGPNVFLGRTVEIALLSRMKSGCILALHWHWPCMDYIEFGFLEKELSVLSADYCGSKWDPITDAITDGPSVAP